jgi:hypothetical protein
MVKAASSELEEERNKLNWRITDKDKKQVTTIFEGVGQINLMEDVCMTCANMCRVQLAIVDVSKSKPLLYQFAWKIIKFIENNKKKLGCATTETQSRIFPMVFMSKIHHFFQHLANFSQNSLNMNKDKVGDSAFETKLVKTGVKLGAKFINKMIKHVEDNLLPKDIPAFAKSLFVKQTTGGIITLVATNTNAKNQEGATVSGEGNKCKSDGDEPGKRKSRKEFSDKSLKMGLFHIRKGAPVAKALPDKGKLKDKVCLDFRSHKKKCNYPHQLCKHRKHYTNWKNVPKEDKPVLLSHMNETGLMWLDAETFEKHKQTQAILAEFAHVLGNATSPMPKSAYKSM